MTGYLVTASVRKVGAIGIFELVRFKVIAADQENALYIGHIIIEEKGLEPRGMMAHQLDKLVEANQTDLLSMVAARWI